MEANDKALRTLVDAMLAGDHAAGTRLIENWPESVSACFSKGATRQNADAFFLPQAGGCIVAGDTALHVAAAATDTYEYDAFGNQITHTGATPNSYLDRGEQYVPDLGLYYLRARYYNPLTGGFMSRDPNNPKLIGPDKIPIDPRMLHKY